MMIMTNKENGKQWAKLCKEEIEEKAGIKGHRVLFVRVCVDLRSEVYN